MLFALVYGVVKRIRESAVTRCDSSLIGFLSYQRLERIYLIHFSLSLEGHGRGNREVRSVLKNRGVYEADLARSVVLERTWRSIDWVILVRYKKAFGHYFGQLSSVHVCDIEQTTVVCVEQLTLEVVILRC